VIGTALLDGQTPAPALDLTGRTSIHDAAAKNGQTPLLIACTAGNATMAAAPLDRGADPNARDASGRRPLEAAVGTGQPGMVKRLLEAGATPAEAATADKRSALHLAAARGRLDITTTMANDEGVGFFVKVDGVTIFHAGDHAAWTGGEENFKPEIDFLAGRGLRADLLFMPVPGTNDPAMNQGVHDAMTQLSAVAVFPGHVSGREEVYREFARDAAKAGMTAPIHCPEFGGDHFAVAGRWRGQLERIDTETVPFDTIIVLTLPRQEHS
jgi:hypothetical protein